MAKGVIISDRMRVPGCAPVVGGLASAVNTPYYGNGIRIGYPESYGSRARWSCAVSSCVRAMQIGVLQVQ
jgi:hypothetical protein